MILGTDGNAYPDAVRGSDWLDISQYDISLRPYLRDAYVTPWQGHWLLRYTMICTFDRWVEETL